MGMVAGYGNLDGTKVNALTAIKNFCLECQGGNFHSFEDNEGNVVKPYKPHKDVTGCLSKDCWLYPYRKGKSGNTRKKKETV